MPIRTLRVERAGGAHLEPATRAWQLVSASLVLAAVTGAGMAVVIGAVHVDDRFSVDHVGGVRIALAQYVEDGTLYPERFDGEVYGGTRFMPLPIVVHAGLAQLTGEYLTSGKLLAYAIAAALGLVLLAVLRRAGCPWSIALGLTVAVFSTPAMFRAATGLRADLLPVALQLGATSVLVWRPDRAVAVVAAVLCALAFLAKVSALWAPVAIVVWLLMRDRRNLRWFLTALAASVVAGVTVVAAVSGGRFFENVFGLAAAGISGPLAVARGPYRFLQLLVQEAPVAWALMPLAGFGAWRALRERRPDIHAVSLVAATAIAMVALVDVGTGSNQLVDVVVLAAIVAVPVLLGLPLTGGVDAGRIVAGAVVLWLVLTGAALTLIPEVQDAVRSIGTESYRSDPLADVASQDTRVLSEDPYVPVSLGQRPVVLDPFMFLRLAREHPDAARRLVERIEAQEFELVVMVEALEPLDRSWWQDQHFGMDVVGALTQSYEPAGRVQGYHLYVPSDGATP